MNLERKKFSLEIGGRTLTIENSAIGEQANAALIATYGQTSVLVTVVMGKDDKETDYFPLTVNYEERFYAAGKIIGSRFVKREGRPSDEAILSGRLIDRVIRPLFDGNLRRDIQVVVTVLSYDEENDPDFVSLIGASTALAVSDIPWGGPVAGVRLAKKNGELILNPKLGELEDEGVSFESFVAGGGGKINMIELGGGEAKEGEVIEAFKFSADPIEKLISFQEEIIKEIGKSKAVVSLSEPNSKMAATVKEFLSDKLEAAVYAEKAVREEKLAALKSALKVHLSTSGFDEADIKSTGRLLDEEINILVHEKILTEEKRPDGRGLSEVRDLYVEAAPFPRTHGSALFIRGNTQALAMVTLAPPGAEQMVETMERSGKRRFMLHYNFPPFSTGETGPFRGPGRREIGHGALAEKALSRLIPSKDEFPYTIRVVSEILSSNGSSSMATVCASALALMDAGVPIKKPAAGIAMGLMTGEDGRYKVLTDIQGPEDHHGDMDLKVAGTRDGVTAIQMDVKIAGVSVEILEKTLLQAAEARKFILDQMEKVLDRPRPELNKLVPKIILINIKPIHIGEVIGPGGKVINGIIERTGAVSIDIEEDGRVFVAAKTKEAAEKAVAEIMAIAKDYEIGDIVEGKVIKILDFGAIVDLGGRDGMIHVSELKNGYVSKVEDVVRLGDSVRVKVIKIENGKIGLSLKQANQ